MSPELYHLLHSSLNDEYRKSGDSMMSTHKTISTGVDCDAQEDAPGYLRDSISHLHLESIAPNQFDAKYESSKYEFWAFCGWFIGNSGVALYQFAPIAFQNLLSQAAGTAGVLRFGGRWAVFSLHHRLLQW